MTASLRHELYFLLCAFLFGVISGPLYDLLRFWRVLLLGKKERGAFAFFLRFLGDVIYMLLLGVAFAVLLYDTHDGVVRMYAPLVSLIGHLFYAMSLGRLTRRLAEASSLSVRRFVLMLFKPFIYLIRKIFQPISGQIKKKTLFFARGCVRIIKKKNKKTSKEEKRSIRKASYGKRKNT